MINRVLIRIKVVQLLYSYLLVENPFSLESQPSAPTKEKRFAYSLYLDTLLLMVRVAENISKRGGELPLYDTRFIRRVVADDRMKSLRRKYEAEPFPFENIVDTLSEAVKESGVYKRFMKSGKGNPAAEDNIWRKLFDSVVAVNPEYLALTSTRENYTLRGVERMKGMIDETFTNFFASADHLPDALDVLGQSLQKARELYIRLLQLPVDITFMRERQLDEAQHKYIKTQEDINPNMRFVDNAFVRALAEDPELRAEVEHYKISWIGEDEILVKSLLRAVMESDIYRQYMEFPVTDFHDDCEFWREIFKNVILRNPDFLEALEENSVFWNDDVDIIGTFVLKTIRRFQDGDPCPILPMYKDEEDARFGAELFSAVIRKKDYYRGLIDEVIDSRSWDSERLAFMDVVIVMTALAEILNFPKIPLLVSFNEYIELAKCYSTPKSGAFVNGLLRSVVDWLHEEGKLDK